jgi:hypothetical protein
VNRAPKTYWLAAAVWIVVGCVVGLAVGWAVKPAAGAGQFEQPAPTAIAERAFPGVRINYVGSGTFQVPNQVTPGTYILTASGLTFGCSWIRLKANDDKPKSVIAEGSINRGGFDRFTVGSGDRVLKLLGDCMWARS